MSACEVRNYTFYLARPGTVLAFISVTTDGFLEAVKQQACPEGLGGEYKILSSLVISDIPKVGKKQTKKYTKKKKTNTQTNKKWVFLTHYNAKWRSRRSINSILFCLSTLPSITSVLPTWGRIKLHWPVWKVCFQKGSRTSQSRSGLNRKFTYSCLNIKQLCMVTLDLSCFSDTICIEIPRACPSCLQRDVCVVQTYALLISLATCCLALSD